MCDVRFRDAESTAMLRDLDPTGFEHRLLNDEMLTQKVAQLLNI